MLHVSERKDSLNVSLSYHFTYFSSGFLNSTMYCAGDHVHVKHVCEILDYLKFYYSQ